MRMTSVIGPPDKERMIRALERSRNEVTGSLHCYESALGARRLMVQEARRVGVPYADIATALGITTSAAFQILNPLRRGRKAAAR